MIEKNKNYINIKQKRGFVIMKSEKEKMLASELYDSGDEELIKEFYHASDLTYEFNHTRPSEKAKRNDIIKQLINAKGSFLIEAPFNCDYGYNIEVGENFYANYGCIILDANKVKIGDNVLFGPNVQIYTATHPIDPIERQNGKGYAKPITIGNNVWIGGGAILCPGIKIGDNVTIGAGSIVTKDIPENVIAAGNPCKVFRNI